MVGGFSKGFVGFVKKNIILFLVIAVIAYGLFASFGHAAQTSGNSMQLANASTVGFNFSAGTTVATASAHFLWNGTGFGSGPPENLTTQAGIHALNGWKVDGLGGAKNISNICNITFTPFRASFPIYAVNDGLALHNPTTGEYAAIVITAVNFTNGNITFDYKYNSDNSTLSACQSSGCFQYQNETACQDASSRGEYCHWEYHTSTCEGGSAGGSGGTFAAFLDCFMFDDNPNTCGNVTVCVKNGIDCDNNQTTFNFSTGIKCENIIPTNASQNTTARNLCNGISTQPLCSWNGTACVENTTKTFNDLPNASQLEGAAFCEDAGTNITKCTVLKEQYFMPCENVSGRCKVDLGACFGGFGGFGGFEDITTKTNCEAIGGTWKTETYTYFDSYGIKQTGTDSWCEFSFGIEGGGFGKETCSDSCWACERNSTQAWPNGSVAKTQCENSSLGFCKWANDSRAFNGFGWCDPDGKMFFTGGDCATSCFSCIAQSQCGASAQNCSWTNESFFFPDGSQAGHCDPASIAQKFNGNITCEANKDNATCGGSTVSCNWNTTWGAPGSTPFGVCHQNATVKELCFYPGDEDKDGSADCRDSECSQDPFCGYGGGAGAGLGTIDPNLCFQHNRNQTRCQAQNGSESLNQTAVCFYETTAGMCVPLVDVQNVGGENAPVILGGDTFTPSEVATNSSLWYLDINGSGLRDGKDVIDFGFMMNNITHLAICNAVYNGSQNSTGTYEIYLDVDKNTTNNCNVTDDNGTVVKGFEYMFQYNVSRNATSANLTENKTAYKCTSGAYIPFSARITVDRMGCSFSGNFEALDGSSIGFTGVLLMSVKKADISNPSNDLRLLYRTQGSPNDTAGPYFYTPGSIDYKPEDCTASGQDLDGDGLKSENDPDCTDYLRSGYVKAEFGAQCGDGFDNDGNGATDCSDQGCKYDTIFCTGSVANPNASDTTAPQTIWNKQDRFPDTVYLNIQLNEPANVTIEFFNTSQICNVSNRSIITQNVHKTNSTADDYKQWHDFLLDSNLTNRSIVANTTYYYKIKAVDPTNNTAISACLNVTTRRSSNASDCPQCSFVVDFDFTPPSGTAVTDPLGAFAYNIDLDNDGNYSDDIFNETVGRLINYTEGKNSSIKIQNLNTTTNWSIEIKNVDIVKPLPSAISNLTSDIIYNTSDGNKSVGISSSAWQSLLQSLGAEEFFLTVPTNGDSLLYCTENDITVCKNVTANATKVASTSSSSTWKVPVTTGLGFSSYKSTAVAAQGASSAGGGGGGGGGGAATGKTVSHTFTRLTPGNVSIAKFLSKNVSIKEISIEVINQKNAVRITITKLDGQPAQVVHSVTGMVYHWLEVNHTNIEDSDLAKNVSIKFNVTKQWLSDNGFVPANVVLQRYKDQWDVLWTQVMSETGDEVEYEASSPGLSIFAVTAGIPAPAPQPPEQPPAPPAQPPTPEQPPGAVPQPVSPTNYAGVIVGVIVVIIIIVVGGWYFMASKKKKAGLIKK